MFRSSMRSSSGSSLFISLLMVLILKTIKIFKKYYQSIVVMWQRMFSMPVMCTVWRRENCFPPAAFLFVWVVSRNCVSLLVILLRGIFMQFRQLMFGILRFRAREWTMLSWCNRVQGLLMTPYSHGTMHFLMQLVFTCLHSNVLIKW